MQPELTGRALLQRLQMAELRTDALKVLPHLLDKRAAVWWGCLCVCQAERLCKRDRAGRGRALGP